MSVYFATGEGPPLPLASNTGWSDVGRWADGLDADRFGAVVQLWEHGLTNEAGPLREQLAAALEDSPPAEASVSDTVAEFLAALAHVPPGDPVLVTDGTSPAPEGGAADQPAATFRR